MLTYSERVFETRAVREPDCSYEHSDALLNTKRPARDSHWPFLLSDPPLASNNAGHELPQIVVPLPAWHPHQPSGSSAENLALRKQLAVLKRSTPRPRLRWRDRFFWVLLSRMWSGWRSAIILVQPETVIRWHRTAFHCFWRWKSRGQPGRHRFNSEDPEPICPMTCDNPLWGEPRIRSEPRRLAYEVAQSMVAGYMPKKRKPP